MARHSFSLSNAPASRPRPWALCVVGLLLGGPALGAATRPPDLLLITLDTTRADSLGCYGGRPALTPNLDQLATRGVRYASAWSPSPLTLPAHTSLLTGLDPAAHGLRDNGWGLLPADVPILAAELARAGYQTAAFPASRVLDRRFGLARGFEHYDDHMAAERRGQYGDPERPAAEVTDTALTWLQRADGKRPIFVWVHFYDAHAPYLGAGGSDRERYAAEVAAVDRELGRLLAGWPAGRRRVVAAVADHGEAFGEHGERGHGLLLYRPTLQVPLLLAGDGVPSGRVIRAPVATVRLPATLLSLVGVPHQLPGRPLPTETEPKQVPPIFHETLFPASAYGWSPLAAVTDGSMRAIAAPRPELYDLATDPAEEMNLLSKPPAEGRRALRHLTEHLRRFPVHNVPQPAVAPEVGRMLSSLGYLSGQSRRSGTLDPKDGLPVLAEFDAACELADRGRAAEAARRLEALVAKSPESVPFLSRLALAQVAAGERTQALSTLDRALALAPLLSSLHLERGELLLALARLEEAAAAFKLATELHPGEATAWLRLAEMELRAGRLEGEVEVLRRGLAAGAASAILLARLGEIFLQRGDLEAADGYLKEATALLPTWHVAWKMWAEVARRQGRPNLAREREARAVP